MNPSYFKESNKNLNAPAGWDEKKDGTCGVLPVYNDGKQSISLWKLSWKERFQILWFGKIWLGVLFGKTQPPVWMDTQKTVFTDET